MEQGQQDLRIEHQLKAINDDQMRGLLQMQAQGLQRLASIHQGRMHLWQQPVHQAGQDGGAGDGRVRARMHVAAQVQIHHLCADPGEAGIAGCLGHFA